MASAVGAERVARSGASAHQLTPWGVVLLAAVLVPVFTFSLNVSASQAGETVPPPPRIGPAQQVDATDVGDPFILPILHTGGSLGTWTSYFRYGTTDWRSNVPTATSTDLVHWQPAPDAFPKLPRWAAPRISMTWAPAALAAGGRYVLYVTTEEASTGRQCIALATAPTPGGPYLDASAHPFVCQRNLGGSIDPSVVRDGSGQLHLTWKSDGNCCGVRTGLWEQDLSSDGLHLRGTAHLLLSADEPWQQGNIEAPAMTPAPGHGFWLFYSGGSWRTADYATGLAYCPTVQGPCRETLNRPFLAGSANLRTPGGLETFKDGDGRLWVALTSTIPIPSRRNPRHYYMNRVLNVARLLPA